VTNQVDNNVSVIGLASNAVVGSLIPVGSASYAIAIVPSAHVSPDHTTVGVDVNVTPVDQTQVNPAPST